MKIIIMSCSDRNSWYNDKIGKVMKAQGESKDKQEWITSQGNVKKSDSELIEK